MKKIYKAGSKSSGALFGYASSPGKAGTDEGGRREAHSRDMQQAVVKYEILEHLEESPQLTAFLAKDPFSERAAVIRTILASWPTP
jgi:hypothetical protein